METKKHPDSLNNPGSARATHERNDIARRRRAASRRTHPLGVIFSARADLDTVRLKTYRVLAEWANGIAPFQKVDAALVIFDTEHRAFLELIRSFSGYDGSSVVPDFEDARRLLPWRSGGAQS